MIEPSDRSSSSAIGIWRSEVDAGRLGSRRDKRIPYRCCVRGSVHILAPGAQA